MTVVLDGQERHLLQHLWRLVWHHGRWQQCRADGAGGPRVGNGQEVTWQRVCGQRHLAWLDGVSEGTGETIAESAVVLDQLFQRHHVRSFINEEVNSLLFNFEMVAFQIISLGEEHAQDIELEFLAAVPDQERSVIFVV